MVKKLRCSVDSSDWVRARTTGEGKRIAVDMENADDVSAVILTPDDARKLRKQIKKALEAIEGVEGKDEEEESDFALGVGPLGNLGYYKPLPRDCKPA